MLRNEKARKRLDQRLSSLRQGDRFLVPPKGWIKAIREALGISQAQLGRRIGVSQQSVVAIENSEMMGTAQLQTLRKIADALDATLVYAIVPRKPLDQMVQERARRIAIEALGRVSQTMRLEDQEAPTDDFEERIEEFIRNNVKERDLWGDA